MADAFLRDLSIDDAATYFEIALLRGGPLLNKLRAEAEAGFREKLEQHRIEGRCT